MKTSIDMKQRGKAPDTVALGSDVIEGNKIIAEFMGFKSWIEMEAYDFEYHSNWSWLMPVIEKIESIKDNYHGHFGVHISSNTCTIQATNFRPDKRIPDPPHYFNCITLETKIKSTWVMVVRFINWYNKNKNK